MKRLVDDMVRYGAVSVVALIVDFGSLILLNSALHINYLVAATIAFLLGLIVNYLLSNGRVFTDPKIANKSINFIAFGAVGVVGLIGNDIIMWLSHEKLQLSVFVSKCVSVAFVFFWNFLARRQLLYQGHKSGKGE